VSEDETFAALLGVAGLVLLAGILAVIHIVFGSDTFINHFAQQIVDYFTTKPP
jgi:hypothetical protein